MLFQTNVCTLGPACWSKWEGGGGGLKACSLVLLLFLLSCVLAPCWLCKSVSLHFPAVKAHLDDRMHSHARIRTHALTETSCFSTALKSSKCLRMAQWSNDKANKRGRWVRLLLACRWPWLYFKTFYILPCPLYFVWHKKQDFLRLACEVEPTA